MYDIDKEKFGVFVAQLRKEQGMTQRELAKKVYVSDKAVSKLEHGFHIVKDTVLDITIPHLYIAFFDKIDYNNIFWKKIDFNEIPISHVSAHVVELPDVSGKVLLH